MTRAPHRLLGPFALPILLSFGLGGCYVACMARYPRGNVWACLDLAAVQLGYWAALLLVVVPAVLLAAGYSATRSATWRPRVRLGIAAFTIVVLAAVVPEAVLAYLR